MHALDTRTRTAHCIDLPGMRNRDVMAMRLRLADGGRRLVVRAGTHAVARIDTRSFQVVPAVAAAPPTSSSWSPARVIGLAITAILLVIAASVPLLRRHMQHNPAHGGRS